MYVSEETSDGQAVIEDPNSGATPEQDVSGGWLDSKDGSTSERHHGPNEAVRHRHRRVSEQAAAQPASQNQEASFWSLLANDLLSLAGVILRLPQTLYPVWSRLFLLYIVLMAFSYLLAYAYRSATAAIAPLCNIPIVGSQLPYCKVHPGENLVDVSRVATAQEGLTLVMNRVGQNYDLARDMVGHEFAVRDLRIRVAASSLSRKKELTRELESLIRYTKQTAK